MKLIIQSDDHVSAHEISDVDILGTVIPGNEKCPVVTNYDTYIIADIGEYESKWLRFNSIEELLERYPETYLFDDIEELYQWLAK